MGVGVEVRGVYVPTMGFGLAVVSRLWNFPAHHKESGGTGPEGGDAGAVGSEGREG